MPPGHHAEQVSSLATPYFEDTPYRATPFSTIGGESILYHGA